MLHKLEKGGNVRHNWRTINQVIDRLEGVNDTAQGGRAGVAELRRRPRDIGGAAGGGGWRGEWSATEQYVAGEIVIFTPSGGQAGAYGCNEDPPVGTAPDTGAPYWTAFPLQTPAVWA